MTPRAYLRCALYAALTFAVLYPLLVAVLLHPAASVGMVGP